MALHYPVMLKQIAKHLQFVKDSAHLPFAMVDCTIGTGGHSIHYLKEHPNLHTLGFDIDAAMIDHLKSNVLPTLDNSIVNRLKLINQSYNNIGKYSPNIFESCQNKDKFDIILADFGYNSLHLASEQRGFSYLKDGDLDMRYSPEFKKCSDVIAEVSSIQLSEIFIKFGEIDKNTALSIAKAIVTQRSKSPIISTKQLVDIVTSALPGNRFKTIVKVFQALRIFINSELDDVRSVCELIPQKLGSEGTGLIVTFHSLEHSAAIEGLMESRDKWRGTHKMKVEDVTEEQVKENRSSRSAKLIVLEPAKKTKEKKYKKY